MVQEFFYKKQQTAALGSKTSRFEACPEDNVKPDPF